MQYLYVQDNAVNWIDPLGLVRQVLKIDGVNISDDEWKQVGSSIYVELNKLGRASQASAWGSRGDRGYLRFTTGMNSEEYEFVFGTDYKVCAKNSKEGRDSQTKREIKTVRHTVYHRPDCTAMHITGHGANL